MELLMVKQRKATLKQQMQSYKIIKGKRDLLKAKFQDKKDAKYWALKKEVDNLEIRFATL
jgi:5-formyltetrahydrofolate cyclo-ligase